MDPSNRQIWPIWSRILHRWGVQEITASLLENLGPLAVLGAQLVYLSQPFLSPFTPDGHLKALASMLEDTAETQAFIQILREANGL